MELRTTEGHKLLVLPDPMGIRMMIIPSAPTLEAGVIDTFGLGINFSNLARAISELDEPGGFQGEGWDSSMRREGGKIVFKFSYKHAPEKTFETSLSPYDSEKLVGVLGDCVAGQAVQHLDSGLTILRTRVGRNEPCPCGSGKKYKKCCGKSSSAGAIPPELGPFADAKDPVARDLIAQVGQAPVLVRDPEFWMELGCTLGSAEEFPLALAAQMRAVEMDPKNPGFLANHAATLGASGKNLEALEILEDLPNENGEFSVLIGNVLSALDREDEALSAYEKSIEYDPNFPFPYRQLLRILNSQGSSLYEYWLLRARRQFPESPSIALAYSHWLIRENRLEELADAEWVDELSHVPDPRVMGRGSDEPRMIIEVQVLQMIARSLVEERPKPLENAVKVLSAARNDWHMCVPAEQIALAARFFGRRDLVWQASRSFCPNCAEGRLGPVFLQTVLAQAALTSGDSAQAVKDAEIGLKADPDEVALQGVYWWALDDEGKPEEALPIAKKVQEKMPDLPHLCYNIGYLAGKVGKPATAIRYYEKEINRDPRHVMAYENLALLRLVEGDVEASKELVARWKEIAKAELEQEFVAEKLSKFEKLIAFVDANPRSISLALDLLKENESSVPFFGAETKIPAEKPTREGIVAALASADPECQAEVSFALSMEARGDHSMMVSQLEAQLPAIRSLPQNAYLSLVEGESQLEDSSRVDFAPCCMAFCKALEITLFDLVFQSFRSSFASSTSFQQAIDQANEPEFEKAGFLTRFVSKGAPLELGSMAFVLNLCGGRTSRRMQLLGHLKSWIQDNGFEHLIDGSTADEIADIAKRFRNPAAHAEAFTREEANLAKGACLNRLKVILEV